MNIENRMKPIDQNVRDHILEHPQSMIVRAPAGSGKTHLLVSRYIKCLAMTKDPERIVAITFTKKAAEEMKERILKRLEQTNDIDPEMKANIMHHPEQLRIFTIDSLCHQIAFTQPELCHLNPKTQLTSYPLQYYQLAAERLIIHHKHNHALEALISLNHGHVDRMLMLLTELLATRDQWIRLMAQHQNHLADTISAQFKAIHDNCLQQFFEAFPTKYLASFISLSKHCTDQLNKPIDYDLLFMQHATCIHDWQTIKTIWMTKTNLWRKTLTKNQGMTPKDAHIKKEMLSLMTTFDMEANDWIQLFKKVDLIPSPDLTEEQHYYINILTEILPILYAELKCVFQENQCVDFIEIASAAHWALSQPSSVIEQWVNTIDHLMIDEFQDTSQQQWALINTLTQHWEPEKQTLFLVGDPMQSIYLFRQADVRLFIQLFTQNDSLTPVSLSQNFRSNAHCVHWANALFSQIFPNQAHLSYAAIPFHESQPIHPETSPVNIHHYKDPKDELHDLVNQIQKLQKSGSVAILTRTRAQLNIIADLCHQHKIPIHAIDLTPLAQQSIVQDLLALVTITQSPNDRLAWLTLLRSPIFGCSLHTCYTCLNHAQGSIISNLQSIHEHEYISLNERQQIVAQTNLIYERIQHPQHENLSQWLFALWQDLNATEGYAHNQHKAQDSFFELLADYDHLSWVPIETLKRHIDKHYFDWESPNSQVQLMTIHKSKGLEFDHVLLPFLNSTERNDSNALFFWETYYCGQEAKSILATSQLDTSHLAFIKHIKQQKKIYESLRVFYVAITRAKTSLTLYLPEKDKKGSWAHLIHHHELFHHQSCNNIHLSSTITDTPLETKLHPVRRRTNIKYLKPKPCFQKGNELTLQNKHQWFGDWVHNCFEQLAYLQDKEHRAFLTMKAQQSNHAILQSPEILSKRELWSKHINSDPCLWLFSEQQHGQNEVTIHYQSKVYRIDRTFIYNQQRWIIDIKTEQITDDDSNITSIYQRYQKQLNGYAAIYHKLDHIKCVCVVYFPISGRAIQWTFQQQTPSWLDKQPVKITHKIIQ